MIVHSMIVSDVGRPPGAARQPKVCSQLVGGGGGYETGYFGYMSVDMYIPRPQIMHLKKFRRARGVHTSEGVVIS